MKKTYLISILTLAISAFSLSSCFNDLDLTPPNGINSSTVYEDPEQYIHVLAKLYAGLAISGNQGPAGNPDIAGIDEGFSQYIRVLWNLQEVTTDAAKCAWNDPGIPELNKMEWSSTNSFVNAMYYRIYFQLPLINEFIRESSDDKMTERGFSPEDQNRIRAYRTEARFLRALSYYHALDLFGNVPFVTEADLVGAFLPPQIKRADLFAYIESELKAIETELPAPQANEYGRADRAAAWTLLARLYLNAEVYTGTERYADCATYCQKVITEGGYSLEPTYDHLFMADNHNSNEMIFAVNFDGTFTQTYGGTTFLTHSTVGGDSLGQIDKTYYGIESGWAGNRSTPQYAAFFPDEEDARNMFKTFGQTLVFSDDTELGQFVVGYPIAKWRNVMKNSVAEFTGTLFSDVLTVTDVAEGTVQVGQYLAGTGIKGDNKITEFITGTGGAGTYRVAVLDTVETATILHAAIPGTNLDAGGNFTDIDFPLMRLADVYLMYAECAARGHADVGTGIGYVNQLRERAYGDALHNVASITPESILEERARELQWEGYRRTDLIRYGLFTGGTYTWAFKGGSFAGTAVSEHLNLFPLPSADVVANPNLDQNPGY